jgi:hypothetical protein
LEAEVARISDWCKTFGYEVVPAEQTLDAAIYPTGNKFVLVDMFTTLDGKWDLSNQGQPGAIPVWALAQYNDPNFTEKGGGTHLFVQVLDTAGVPNKATQVAFWSDGYDKLASFDGKTQPSWLKIVPIGPSGWCNLFMEHAGSGYDYESVHGPWCCCKMPGLSDVVRYLGLPKSAHISTFMVFQEVPRKTDPVDPPDPPVTGDTLRALLTDAKTVVSGVAARIDKALALLG